LNVFNTGLLFHVAAVQRLSRKYGVDATITMADMLLQLRGRGRAYSLYPQFIQNRGGQLMYAAALGVDTRSFAGWRPYVRKRWPTGTGKFAFKDFCAQRGLPTPRMWRAPAPDMRDFLVKDDQSSFGLGMHGPFKVHDARNPAAQARAGTGYYEAFIPGRVVKAWYWQDRLMAFDLKEFVHVTGDGARTLRELIAPIVRPTAPKDEWLVYAETAAYQDLTLDCVPARGRRVMVDFRNGTYANPVQIENQNMLAQMGTSPPVRQMKEFGPVLWQGIPEDVREATLYTIDAMFDEHDGVWLLEMNCNPVCHPDVYDAMFETLFGAPGAVEPAPVPRASAPAADDFLRRRPAPAPPAPMVVPTPEQLEAIRRFRWLS
jgi:hypothetical protein